jgi:hypothetical protein
MACHGRLLAIGQSSSRRSSQRPATTWFGEGEPPLLRSDAILPKTLVPFSAPLRLPDHSTHRATKLGREVRIPKSQARTRLEPPPSGLQPKPKNHPPRAPTSPSTLRFTLPLYIPTLALSLPPQLACLLRACLAVCLSSYLSSSRAPLEARNATRKKIRAQPQCRCRGSPRWTRPARG